VPRWFCALTPGCVTFGSPHTARRLRFAGLRVWLVTFAFCAHRSAAVAFVRTLLRFVRSSCALHFGFAVATVAYVFCATLLRTFTLFLLLIRSRCSFCQFALHTVLVVCVTVGCYRVPVATHRLRTVCAFTFARFRLLLRLITFAGLIYVCLLPHAHGFVYALLRCVYLVCLLSRSRCVRTRLIVTFACVCSHATVDSRLHRAIFYCHCLPVVAFALNVTVARTFTD